MPPTFSDWNDTDLTISESFRLERLRSFFPELLSTCLLYLDQGNQLQIHAHDPEHVDTLLDSLSDLGWAAWVVGGATQLSLWFWQEQLVACPTQEQTPIERLLEEGLQSKKPPSKELIPMSATTLQDRPSTSKRAAPSTGVTTLPARVQVRSLTDVALAAKQPADRLEALCHQRGYMVVEDVFGNAAILFSDATALVRDLLTEDAMALLNQREPLRAVTSNGAMATIADPSAAQAVETPETSLASNSERKPRSRERTVTLDPSVFRIQRSLKATVDSALKMFADTPGRRKQIARAIGNETVDGQKYVQSILEFVEDPEKRQKYESDLIRRCREVAKAKVGG